MEQKQDKIIVPNWFEAEVLRESDLGWNHPELAMDARSSDSWEIAKYFIRMGVNITFYNVMDGEFYLIFQECSPIEVRRIYKRPDLDGKCVCQQIYNGDHDLGEVVATIAPDYSNLDDCRIDGEPCGGEYRGNPKTLSFA